MCLLQESNEEEKKSRQRDRMAKREKEIYLHFKERAILRI